MCIYDESMHHESRDKAAAVMMCERGSGRKNPSRPPPTGAPRTVIGVERRRSIGGGMRGGEGNRLASRPPRRLAHPNYWAPANCPTPGPYL